MKTFIITVLLLLPCFSLADDKTLLCESPVGKKVLFNDGKVDVINDGMKGTTPFFIISKTKKKTTLKVRWDDSELMTNELKKMGVVKKKSLDELQVMRESKNYIQAIEMSDLKTVIYDIYLDRMIVMVSFKRFDIALEPLKSVMSMRCK